MDSSVIDNKSNKTQFTFFETNNNDLSQLDKTNSEYISNSTTSTSSCPYNQPQESCPYSKPEGTCPIPHNDRNFFYNSKLTERYSLLAQLQKDIQIADENDWENKINPLNQMPIIPNKSVDGGSEKLSSTRVVSSIPKTGTNESWIYPSPQQFYNSLRRKNKAENADEMETTVWVHNLVNEQSWKRILKWEKMHEKECQYPSLKRFIGKSEELSPKARWMSIFSSLERPFDRHDWFVDRCGTSVRYILDYYDNPKANDDLQIYIDVRPALDSFSSFWDRLRYSFNSYFNNSTQENKRN